MQMVDILLEYVLTTFKKPQQQQNKEREKWE